MPISRHPLFAPMVALWFAALFGLGSLAIRPTLLESAVLALRLDLVVPAAAPPLGFTFRILLALSLFVIGGAIGYGLARRLTRQPGPQSDGFRFARVKAKAETAAPVVADDFDEDDDFNRLASARQVENEAANTLPGRRRALAMEEDFSTEVHDAAPVPGHLPQILDLADLGAFDVEEPAEQADAPAASAEPVAAVSDLAEDAQEPQFDPWNRHPTALHAAAPFASAPDAEAVAEAEAPAPFAAPVQTCQVNGDFSRPQAMDHGAPAFAPPASFDAPPARSFDAPAAGSRISFEPARPESVFSDTAGQAVDAIVHSVGGRHDPANDEMAPAAEIAPEPEYTPETEAAEAEVPEPVAETAEQLACTFDPAPAQPELGPVFGNVSGDAAERLVAMPLTSLGVVQLAERLALAIARKREGASTEAAESAVLPEVAADFSAPQPPVPVAFPVPPSLNPPQPIDFAQPAPVEALAAADEDLVPEAAEPAAAPEAPLSSLFRGLPAALRPVSLDDEADDEPLPSLLPPRGFPKLPDQIAAEAPVAPTAPLSFAPPAEDQIEAAGSEAPDDEESYASLLEMKAPPRAFVRIEEPEDERTAVEPVVIFPGQDSRQSFGNPANGFAQNSSESALNGASRMFDGPVSPNAPMRVPPAMARSIDAEETERQLKAALATLQRMSGAA
ncbi:MAG: hypothetical protein ACKOUT_02130 [Novosphingobium sp.]